MNKFILRRWLALLMALLLVLTLMPATLAEQANYTLADLEAMNGGELEFTTNSDGCITFLRGNFYDGVIESGDDVEKALIGVSELLGADDSTLFVRGACLIDDQDYSYYTFYQWQAEVPVDYAIVKVIVSPDGHTAALSSSLSKGVAGKTDQLITPEQAMEAVKAHLSAEEPDTAYTYSDTIDRTMVHTQLDPENFGLVIAYVVYTNNPKATLQSNGLAYIAHYVSAAGDYLYSMPVSAIADEQAMTGSDAERFFDGMTSTEYTGEVTSARGMTRKVTVPVMLDESTGAYYLGNAQRKMIAADYWEFMYNKNTLKPITSQTNDDWDADSLLAYENYIQAYDFYSAVGWDSTDGLGTPILLLTHYVDQEHNPVANACYLGMNPGGWQTFATTSDVFNVSEPLDVIGHEYTHGVTTASMSSILYENQYGAINESMSDIMGNLIEMLCGRTEDTLWQIGENSGEALRCMTDPHQYSQPVYVGDLFYVPDAATPTAANDRGGVHINNSLLAGVAPKLYAAGMTLEEERRLWTTFICALTPRTGYAEASLMLPFAADVTGLSQHQGKIAEALSEIRLETDEPFGTVPDGCAQITMALPDGLDQSMVRLILRNSEGQLFNSYPDASTGSIHLFVQAGKYLTRLMLMAADSGQTLAAFRFDGKAWTTEEIEDATFVLQAGETLALPMDGIEYEAPAEERDAA